MAPTEVLQLDENDKVVSIQPSSVVQSTGTHEKNASDGSPTRARAWVQILMQAFLPAGYPNTVTPDYLEYQMYDSLQAFSSSIAGLLASRAVLQGVGVGNADASPTAVLLLNILQDSFGRLATILFAWRLGTALQPECKMWRLTADLFNDGALILDCLSPALPTPMRVSTLCMSSIFRALCGVCASGSKAALGIHFASNGGDVGDLSAKESSQETVVALAGMLAGSLVVSFIQSTTATWLAMLILILVHLETNRRAVRAVSMNTLNRQRASIVLSHWIQHNKVLTPKAVSRKERIFERDGALRWADDAIIGYCEIGVTFSDFAGLLVRGPLAFDLGDDNLRRTHVSNAVAMFEDLPYLLWCRAAAGEHLLQVKICLKADASAQGALLAWRHALLVAQLHKERKKETLVIAELLQKSFVRLKELPSELDALRLAGWDVENTWLLTGTDSRLDIVRNTKKDQ